MKDKEITESIGQMIDSKNIDDIQLASAIIKAQPDMIDSDALKGHWYNIHEIINPSNTVEYTELYHNGGSSDKVYIVVIERKNNLYHINSYYGRRGRGLIKDYKGSYNFKDSALRQASDLIKNKIKKGYIKLN
jgi:hypothetical protein